MQLLFSPNYGIQLCYFSVYQCSFEMAMTELCYTVPPKVSMQPLIKKPFILVYTVKHNLHNFVPHQNQPKIWLPISTTNLVPSLCKEPHPVSRLPHLIFIFITSKLSTMNNRGSKNRLHNLSSHIPLSPPHTAKFWSQAQAQVTIPLIQLLWSSNLAEI